MASQTETASHLLQQVATSLAANEKVNDDRVPRPRNGNPHFPSMASLSSSAWSSSSFSSSGDSPTSSSYAWSESFDSDEDSSDDSSYSDMSSAQDDGANNDAANKIRNKKGHKPQQATTAPAEGLPFPMEGLGMNAESILANLKKDLEKVGRTIIQSNVGEACAERAHVLASINWLSGHVPDAVLDHLGHEIRAILAGKNTGDDAPNKSERNTNDTIMSSLVNSEEMSEVSDLSDAYLNEGDLDDSDIGDLSERPEEAYGDLGQVAEMFSGDSADGGGNGNRRRMSGAVKSSILEGLEQLNCYGQLDGVDPMAAAAIMMDDSHETSTRDSNGKSTISDAVFRENGTLGSNSNGLSRSLRGARSSIGMIPEHRESMQLTPNRNRRGSDIWASETVGSTPSMSLWELTSSNRSDPREKFANAKNSANHRSSAIWATVSTTDSDNKALENGNGNSSGGGLLGRSNSILRRGQNENSMRSSTRFLSSLRSNNTNDSGQAKNNASGKNGKSTLSITNSGQALMSPNKEKKSGVSRFLKKFYSRRKLDNKEDGDLEVDIPYQGGRQGGAQGKLYHIDHSESDEAPIIPKESLTNRIEMHPGNNSSNNDETSEYSDSLGDDDDDDDSTNGSIHPNRANKNDEEQYWSKIRDRRLPNSSSYYCALLFVDISGFTKLSTMLDPETLSKAINAYFQLIVNEVINGDGDLMKFAGDAVFVEWKASAEMNLEYCVEAAASCASKIVEACSGFSVVAAGTSTTGRNGLVASQVAKIDSLNVHCGIGAGHMVGVHVGDYRLRREYLLLGEPIRQATVATDHASLGEVAVSPAALGLLARVCKLDTNISLAQSNKPTIIAQHGVLKYKRKDVLGRHQTRIKNEKSRGVTNHVEGLEVDALRQYRSMMSLYVHPVVVDNDVANNTTKARLKRTAQERHREEAELRNVFVMFINPIVEIQVKKNATANKKLFKQLNDIMNLSSRELERYCGHLRQFIIDDKGLVMIITFGLRGTTIPNMVAERALPATIAIHNALQMELGVQSKIGATIGDVYCGVVGGVKRHEYAVLGPSVNLAARLMASPTNPGILVDNAVRRLASRSYGFNALPPVPAKGYSEPVPIFEPLSPLERMWGRIQPNFAGRKAEIMKLMGMARDMVLHESPSKIVIVQAKSGMGKTTMVAHSIEHIRKLMGANKHRLIVTKNVSKESDSLVPFGVFRSILLDVLSWFRASNDDKTHISGASCYTSLEKSIAWESLSGRSVSQSTIQLTESKSADLLRSVCRELDMPTSFMEHAMYRLLGVENADKRISQARIRPPPTKLMVSFMARAFRRCTQDAKLVVVALDDVHNADELSWRVLRELFETADNVLIIGTSYPIDTFKLRVEVDFWNFLRNRYHNEGRFILMELGCLNKEEILSMVMKTLGLQKKEVKQELLDGLLIQTGGMPHFVNEILEHVKRQMALDDDFDIADMTYDSFGDLVLQRLDAFNGQCRNMLNIGAVIGLSFSLKEVIAVQQSTSDAPVADIRGSTIESLEVAVTEGLLEARTFGGDYDSDDNSDQDPDTRYSFYHPVWRSALMSLMLEGRKRDLHRVIAETLEAQNRDIGDHMFQTRLFNHWRESHIFSKTAELALKLGKHFEDRLGIPAQSIRVYNDAMDIMRESTEGDHTIGGFSLKVLNSVDVEELTFIIRLQIALGQALAMAQQMTESVAALQDALRLTQTAQSSAELKDRSILFPVFTGLSLALKRGHIVQDEQCRYEHAMIRRYLKETQMHQDPIYIIHAITLQEELYCRLGELPKALETHQNLEPLYNVEEHSAKLSDRYGSDLGAQSFASSALWNSELGNVEDALGTCWFVIEELMPQLDKRNVHGSFMILYPIIWVMKENEFALEAREYFVEFVCEAYAEYFGEGRSTFFLPLYDPIMMLLDLSGNTDVDEILLEEYLDWALEIDNLGFGTLINSKTGELGRTADSIAAEVCYLLAELVDEEEDRIALIENGIEVAKEDLAFTVEKRMVIAEHYTSDILDRLESLLDE